MASVLHASKIGLYFENKEQLIRFRVYGKRAASAQTGRGG